MTNIKKPIRNLLMAISVLIGSTAGLIAQDGDVTLSGKILESGSGLPLPQAVVSVAVTGESTTAGEDGSFTIELPTPSSELLINYPGYHTRALFTKGQENITIYMTRLGLRSDDEIYSSILGTGTVRDAMNSVTLITKPDLEGTATSSFEHALHGQIPGLQIIEQSGMPGHSSWMNMRGVSSVFGRNVPLVIIDGMIHEINFPVNFRVQGHLFNPLDIVDIDDVVDISALKVGEGQLGGAGSNGVLYVNTEQKGETSASILMKGYGGVAFAPTSLDVMNRSQFETYFNGLLLEGGNSQGEIDDMYPWLNLNTGTEFYRYNNNTDWQKELFRPTSLQKYYLFLKGGDDIATYNISSGYLRHGAPYDQWLHSRYNLRLNGRINITKRLSVTPNTKLSLSDTYLSNMGPVAEFNPVTSALLKSPNMLANERSELDGTVLFPYDDVGAYNISNPAVLIDNALGSDRTFQLLSSVKADFQINPNILVSNIIGTSVSNDRVNIFLPDIGVVQLDSARNSPQDMVTEYRSTQNHTTVTYMNTYGDDHNLDAHAGLRYMNNIYKNNQGIDLNTASDDFRSLGQGGDLTNPRSNDGASTELKWLSYFLDANYSFRDKYYLRVSASFDGASVFNKKNRYNLYPSLFGAWRISSEEFMNGGFINDLKLRASYSQTGNMFSTIYQYSKLTYTGRRYNQFAVLIRDYNPNEDLEAERKSTINTGIDLSVARKAINLHVDYYMSSINNLIINQQLPYNYGFTDYFNNGGAMSISGIEAGVDARFYFGQSSLFLSATATKQSGTVKSLDFLNPETEALVIEVAGAEYVASVDNPINAFYGYRALGVYDSDAEAAGMIGPNGREMGGGDVIFEDLDTDGRITDADKQIIGDPNPDLFGSFTATFSLKRISVSALLTYSLGNDVYNYVRLKTTGMDGYGNQLTDVLDRWTPDNTGAELPRAAFGDPNGNNAFSDRWIEDGSYARFKQLKVSYTAPNFLNLGREATVYLTGTNLLTLTKYTGYDPETMFLNDPFFMGIDYGKLPMSRSVIFGIQLSL